MAGKIVFPKQSKGTNILKIYGVITEDELESALSKERLYFDSVDSAIDEYVKQGKDVDRQVLIEINIRESNNLNLSSSEVAKTFKYLYNAYSVKSESNIDNELLQLYIRHYAVDTVSVSRVILGDEQPYKGSKLRLGTKTIYSIIDLEGVIGIKYYNIVMQEDTSEVRTLIIPR
ncbi:MAG: hypothetical protein J6A59_14215 [Lachnospiraceae bacterium]|nr:hypothetical protein [Lachnospiraceae bacterium]